MDAVALSVAGAKVAVMVTMPEESEVDFEIEQPVDAVQLFLDRLGDALVDVFRRGAGIDRADGNLRRRDIRDTARSAGTEWR